MSGQVDVLAAMDWSVSTLRKDGYPNSAGVLRHARDAVAALIAERYALREALSVLADEADNFSVSGVYFNEKCMGHKGLELARAALALTTGESA